MRLLILTQAVDENNPILGFFLNWIKEFAERCESVTVICLYKGEYELPENVKVLSLGKENNYELRITNYDFLRKIRYIINFYKYIWQEKNNYDAVFVHMNQIYVILGGLVWKAWNKKIGFWYTHKKVGLTLRLAEKITNIIFTASAKSFRLPSKKAKIVGHGIDTNKFIPAIDKISNGKFKIVTIGRISPAKDYETLINAIEMVGKDENAQNIEVDIIGEPGTPEQKEYFDNLKALVVEKKLESTVRFLGAIANKNIIPFLQNADLFINTSHTGSLDKAILEAMACNLLVITCNEAAADDVLFKYKDLLFFEKQDVKSLADKIRQIYLMSIGGRTELGNELRQIVVRSHNLVNLIDKIVSEYKNI